MADHGPPDANDYVMYLRQIAANIENIGKACQEICKVQQQTILTAQKLIGGARIEENPPAEHVKQGAGRSRTT